MSANVEHWTRANAEFDDAEAARRWAETDVSWGLWKTPEAEVGVLGDVSGLDVVELGCGTAYFSAWLARRGARVVGVDPTPAQLETARRMEREFGLEFALVEGFGEEVPLPAASFDLVLSEYGASLFADPDRWIPEAHRLLRPGGRLVFMRPSPLLFLCGDEDGLTERLHRPMRGMKRFEKPGDSDEFVLSDGELLGLLRRTGFEVESLVEVYAPEGAQRHDRYSYTTPEWAAKWPNEEIWAARKPS
ncbi:MAG TPA: class I SAM-dependent methyltransferase [Gaiellaceae bacterium]|nr:class I SAM-dependent methyltransferase [Gaiellaceae bacterium]